MPISVEGLDLPLRGAKGWDVPFKAAITELVESYNVQEQAVEDAVGVISGAVDANDATIAAAVEGGAATTAALNSTIATEGTVFTDAPLIASVRDGADRATVVVFDPDPNVGASTSGTGFSTVNAALQAVVIVPDSGKVIVELSAIALAAANTTLIWGLTINGLEAAYTAQHVVSGGSAGTSNTKYHATIVVDKLSDGTPLTPGSTVTLVWRQRSTAGGVCITRFGAAVGAAVMKVSPVTGRLTARPVTSAIENAVAVSPMWLCDDGVTLLGASRTLAGIYTATDPDVLTWTRVGTSSFVGGVAWIRQLDDGEILVGTNITGSAPATVHRSTGWAEDPATATFAEVLRAHDTPTKISFSELWSISVYGSVVAIAEYGPKAAEDNMARYVYLSTDFGQTWETVFDLFEFKGVAVEAHMHGVAYDPWWNALWVAYGDSDAAWGCAVSFDMGRTWRELPRTQKFTTIIPMENCILWLTDRIGQEGVWRTPRTSKRRLILEPAFVMATGQPTIKFVGTGVFQSRRAPNLPVTMSFHAGGVATSGRAVVTYDGYAFKEVWNDNPNAYINQGLKIFLGPTLSGKFVARLTRDNTEAHTVVVTPA